MKLFIVIHASPHIHGERIKEFRHRPDIEPGLYVWQNRALTPENHFAEARKLVERYEYLRPYTRVVTANPAPAGEPACGEANLAQISELKAALEQRTEEVKKIRAVLTPPQRARYDAPRAPGISPSLVPSLSPSS